MQSLLIVSFVLFTGNILAKKTEEEHQQEFDEAFEAFTDVRLAYMGYKRRDPSEPKKLVNWFDYVSGLKVEDEGISLASGHNSASSSSPPSPLDSGSENGSPNSKSSMLKSKGTSSEHDVGSAMK